MTNVVVRARRGAQRRSPAWRWRSPRLAGGGKGDPKPVPSVLVVLTTTCREAALRKAALGEVRPLRLPDTCTSHPICLALLVGSPPAVTRTVEEGLAMIDKSLSACKTRPGQLPLFKLPFVCWLIGWVGSEVPWRRKGRGVSASRARQLQPAFVDPAVAPASQLEAGRCSTRTTAASATDRLPPAGLPGYPSPGPPSRPHLQPFCPPRVSQKKGPRNAAAQPPPSAWCQ